MVSMAGHTFWPLCPQQLGRRLTTPGYSWPLPSSGGQKFHFQHQGRGLSCRDLSRWRRIPQAFWDSF